MPNTVIFSLGVELILMILTLVFLNQPQFIFGHRGDSKARKPRIGLIWSGLILLSLTFCWSIILGIVLSINELTFRL